MFGMGMGEIVLIAIVALLVVGPDRLPGAAKSIGKGIRDLRKQTKDLQSTIENDTQIGDAVREIKGALRGDPETLYKRATGEDFNPKEPVKTAKADASAAAEGKGESEGEGTGDGDAPTGADSGDTTVDTEQAMAANAPVRTEADRAAEDALNKAAQEQALIDEGYGNTDDGWGAAPVNPHVDLEDPDLPKIRTPSGALSRGDDSDDDTENA